MSMFMATAMLLYCYVQARNNCGMLFMRNGDSAALLGQSQTQDGTALAQTQKSKSNVQQQRMGCEPHPSEKASQLARL